MTIVKGQPWGRRTPCDGPEHVAATDAEAAGLLRLHGAASGVTRMGLIGGDLCRTISGPGDAARLTSPDAMTFPIDALNVTWDGGTAVAVAHVIARKRAWGGQIVAIMNAEWLGLWDLATKGHPNDGFADVVQAELTIVERLKARKRLALGAHVPHPKISERRMKSASFEFQTPTPVYIDGVPVGRTRHLAFATIPDAFEVVI